MPTYDYKCLKCNRHFERYEMINSNVVSQCPICRGESKRMISAGGGFILKGSGFYSNDYKKPGK